MQGRRIQKIVDSGIRRMRQEVLYREVQRFRQRWLWAVILIVNLLVISLFAYGTTKQLIYGEPWGDRPLPDTALLIMAPLVILLTTALVVLFRFLQMTTVVRRDGLFIRFHPFHRSLRRILMERVLRSAVVNYSALTEYGGWGIRYGLSGKAYNVSGNRGVCLEFDDGKRLLIGSQRPEELRKAISALLSDRSRS